MMSSLFGYALVFIAYMGLMIWVGTWTRRKVRSAEGFAIGGRSIGPWVTALSFVAAYFSSVVIIGGGAFGYRFGMATVWIAAANVVVGAFLAWVVLGKRIRVQSHKLGAMTISEYLSKRYKSRPAGMLSAAVIAVFLIVYNLSVLKGMANTLEGMIQIPYWAGVLISGAIMIFYVSLGGYFAVVWTGFIQAWFMLAGLLLLGRYTLSSLGGFTAIHHKLAEIDPGYVGTPGVWGWAGLISYATIVSLGVWGMPQLMIRFYSVRDTRVLRSGTVLATIGACMALIPYFIGAASRIVLPELTSADLAIPTLTKQLLPTWAGALFLSGVIAAGMSTFAGVLIIISTSAVRDLWVWGLKKRLSDAAEVRAGRYVSLAVGFIAVLMALRPPALILVLTAFSWTAIASVTLWPLVLGLLWKRTNRRGVLPAMVAGAGTALLWIALKNPGGVHGFMVGVGLSLVVMVAWTLLAHQEPSE
jgi:SSS family solute:Na+ symporter